MDEGRGEHAPPKKQGMLASGNKGVRKCKYQNYTHDYHDWNEQTKNSRKSKDAPSQIELANKPNKPTKYGIKRTDTNFQTKKKENDAGHDFHDPLSN